MKLFLDNLSSILLGIGGWVVITLGVSSWIGARIAEKLSLKWKQEYTKEIEHIKARLLANQDMFKLTLDSYATGHQHSQERRLKAVESIWDFMLRLREYVSPLITFYSVLLPEEYNEVLRTKSNIFSLDNLTKKTILNEEVEKYRPFLGEHLWNIFFIYRVFLLRNVFLFVKGKQNDNVIPWYEDANLINFVELSLGKKEILNLDFKKIGSFQMVIGLLEQKILTEMNKLISGEMASESSFKEARKLLELVQKDDFLRKISDNS